MPVLEAIATDTRRVESDAQRDRTRSDADKLDSHITDWVKDR